MDAPTYFRFIDEIAAAPTLGELARVRARLANRYPPSETGVSGLLEACDRRDRELREHEVRP